MKRTSSTLLAFLLLSVTGAPAQAEDLRGDLGVGEKLEVFLFPHPGFFARILAAVGLSSPPIPVSLTEAAVLGRDSVVIAKMDEDWGIFAQVHPSEGEEKWYAIGKPSVRFFDMTLRDGVTISRVRKSADQIFEGTVKGNPWFLRVDAPDKIMVAEETRPEPVGMKFWLDEFIYSYDEGVHSSPSGQKKVDNFTVLKKALVTGLPDELDTFAEDPMPFERFKQLKEYVERAGAEEMVPLRDLLEAKVEHLEKTPIENPDARKVAQGEYEKLLDYLRKRTSDE